MRTLEIDELRALLSTNPDRRAAKELLSDEELARWAAGELTEAEQVRFLERVAASPERIELWRAVAELARGASRLGKQAPGGDADVRRVVPIFAVRSRANRRWRWDRVALLAAALVAAVGLAVLLHLHARLAELEAENRRLASSLAEPARVRMLAPGSESGVELLASGLPVLHLSSMRGGDEPVAVERLFLPPTGDPIPVAVTLPGKSLSALEVGLFDETDRPRWTARLEVPTALRSSERLTLVLRLPRSALSPPKRYHLALVQRGATHQVFQVDLEVARSARE